ncbi:MAG: preprotein translocase subunit SecE [Bacilli bacterium]
MKKLKEFASGVKKEALRVHWPKGKDLIKYSTVCIALILFFALFFYGLDALFAFLRGVLN